MCRRLYDRTAHAQKWAQFQAPLLLIWDTADSYLLAPSLAATVIFAQQVRER